MSAATEASQRVLVVGATSAIATEVARRFASRHARLFLVGRRDEALRAAADDLRVRGASDVDHAVLEATDVTNLPAVIERAWARWEGFDVSLVAHGVLPDQARSQASIDETLASFDINAGSVLALLTELGNRFESQRAGVIGVISSPAGNRGRASNYVYGAAKAAVSNFASGLRHRLHPAGVRVVTILPGFVDTPMTARYAKGPLWAQPARVAADIDRALARANGTIYTPWFWRWIMLVIGLVPERVFVRTKL